MPAQQGSYSPTWRAVFADTIDPVQTLREARFVLRQLARNTPAAPRILDVCCGSGRHAHALRRLGCLVTGVDADAAAIDRARRAAPPGAHFVVGDARALAPFHARFDAALCLWQSFGCFDRPTNLACLEQLAAALDSSSRGVVILDLYNPAFFAAHLGTRRYERSGVLVEETKTMDGDRLTVRLSYDRAPDVDVFSWTLYTPEALSALAAPARLRPVRSCSTFDESTPPAPDQPRYQVVFAPL